MIGKFLDDGGGKLLRIGQGAALALTHIGALLAHMLRKGRVMPEQGQHHAHVLSLGGIQHLADLVQGSLRILIVAVVKARIVAQRDAHKGDIMLRHARKAVLEDLGIRQVAVLIMGKRAEVVHAKAVKGLPLQHDHAVLNVKAVLVNIHILASLRMIGFPRRRGRDG